MLNCVITIAPDPTTELNQYYRNPQPIQKSDRLTFKAVATGDCDKRSLMPKAYRTCTKK
ncbi:MAG: hypothetical protein HC903_20870 [Methylacidiphilales bacterium]|nr:hypothetical protein [Candidatus Methylacidiphilales bacterium]